MFKRIQSLYQREEQREKASKLLENARSAIVFYVKEEIDEDRSLVAVSAYLNEETEGRDIYALMNGIREFLKFAQGENNAEENKVH